MKKIFTSVMLLICFIQTKADHGTGRLSVTVMMNTAAKVYIDGYAYRTDFGNYGEVFLDRVIPGRHMIKVVAGRGRSNGRFDRDQRVVFEGNVMIRAGMHLDMVINRFGRAYMDEYYVQSGQCGNGDFPDNQGGNGNGCGYGYGYGYGYGGHVDVMQSNEFDQFKTSLRKIAFEDTRLNSLKAVINNNYFSVQQVMDLMRLFAFEDNKLEVAKVCYSRTIDKTSYYLVNDVFSFNSSKDEMNRYLQTTH